jgi:hypothetical protein
MIKFTNPIFFFQVRMRIWIPGIKFMWPNIHLQFTCRYNGKVHLIATHIFKFKHIYSLKLFPPIIMNFNSYLKKTSFTLCYSVCPVTCKGQRKVFPFSIFTGNPLTSAAGGVECHVRSCCSSVSEQIFVHPAYIWSKPKFC